jgi:hypothetical protein
MSWLYTLTVPGLSVPSDWASVHDRLLHGFPENTDVLATTMRATLLIVYQGDANVAAWLEGISDAVLARRIRVQRAPRLRTRIRDRERDRTWGLRRAHNPAG